MHHQQDGSFDQTNRMPTLLAVYHAILYEHHRKIREDPGRRLEVDPEVLLLI